MTINKDLCAKQWYTNKNRGLVALVVLRLRRCPVTSHRSQTWNCRYNYSALLWTLIRHLYCLLLRSANSFTEIYMRPPWDLTKCDMLDLSFTAILRVCQMSTMLSRDLFNANSCDDKSVWNSSRLSLLLVFILASVVCTIRQYYWPK